MFHGREWGQLTGGVDKPSLGRPQLSFPWVWKAGKGSPRHIGQQAPNLCSWGVAFQMGIWEKIPGLECERSRGCPRSGGEPG